MYKIELSDKSFIIVDKAFKITIFDKILKRKITVEHYLSRESEFKDYVMRDKIDNKKIDRTFTIEETDLDYPIGMRIKLAKDVEIGDLIMGPDKLPRKVEELHTGEDDMYNITVNGETYTVNGGHIMALVDKETGEHLEIQVNTYLHMNDEFKSHYVMEAIVD